jgi:hypothetical protein
MARRAARSGADDVDIVKHALAALPVALLLPIVGALALALRDLSRSPLTSTAAIFTALVACFLAAFVLMKQRPRPRAGILAACHVLAWVPFVALGAFQVLQDGIVPAPVLGCSLGSGQRWYTATAPQAVALCLVLSAAVGVLLAHRKVDPALRAVAFGVVGLALLTTGYAASKLGRPDPDTYLASLPEVAELTPDASTVVAGRAYRYESIRGGESGPTPVFADGAPFVSPPVECRFSGLRDENKTYYPGAHACPRLHIRVDDAAGLGILERSSPYPTEVPSAFRLSDGAAIGIAASDVHDRIAPPIGWTVGAGIGGSFGVFFLILARKLRRRAVAIDGCEAKHAGNGWVELANGERLRVDCVAALPTGPVVLGERRQEMPTYRIPGAPTFGAAWAGTLAALRTARLDLATSLEAIALAAAAIGVTPLIVARVLGAL